MVKADREQLQTELAVRGLELGEAVSVSHLPEFLVLSNILSLVALASMWRYER